MTKRLTVKLLLLVLCACVGTVAPVAATDDTTMITMQSADSLLSSGNFKHVKGKADIPKLWWKATGLDGMADIGGPFSSGCTGPEPHSRLISAAVTEPYAVILSEQGGIAYFTEFRIFKHEGSAVNCVYREIVREPRLSEIRKKLGE